MNVSGSRDPLGLGIALNTPQRLIFKFTPKKYLPFSQYGSPKPASLASFSNHYNIGPLQYHSDTPALISNNNSRLPLTVTRSSAGAQADTSADDDGIEERNLSHALLLAFYATQDRSLFSSKCLIETVIEIYRRGYTLDNIKLDITIATLSTLGDPLKPVMLDILLTWTALIMMTLKTIGVPLLPEGEARAARRAAQQEQTVQNDDDPAEHEDRMSQALEFFVKDCINKFLSGTTLFRLQLQQNMQGPFEGAEDPEAVGKSPAVIVLQQNTRLVITALELVKNCGLSTTMALTVSSGIEQDEEESEQDEEESEEEEEDILAQRPNTMAPTHISYIDGFVDPSKTPSLNLQGTERATAIRCSAARLLVSFNGAALGYLRSARDFIEQLYLCYSAGWTADELFSALYDEEFAQSGGVSFNLANTPGGKHISAALFARWITLTYMALGILGVEHPGASQKAGWAWVENLSGASGVSSGGGLEAHAIAEFVSSTLTIATQSDDEGGGDEEARNAGGRRRGKGQDKVSEGTSSSSSSMGMMGRQADGSMIDPKDRVVEGESYGAFGNGFEDPSLLRTSSFALILSQEMSLMLSTLHVHQRIGCPVGLDYNSKITNLKFNPLNPLRVQQHRYSATPTRQRRHPSVQVKAISLPFLPMEVSLPTLAICTGIGYVIFNVIRFAKAYADLTLLSKRRIPQNAFQDKVVWIVGASQGLGEALTLYFAAAGARLILSSRSIEKLETVKATCLNHISAENIVLLPLDLTGAPEALDQAADQAFSAFNSAGVDYVIHNAGASQHAAAEDTSHEVATALINLNLLGPIALAKATLPLMLQRGSGRQVVVASMSAVVPSPGQAVYAAAKSGLRAYFSSVTSELADTGVGATVCCPGPLATGADGKPRVVYGPNGLIQQANTGMSKKRVSATRAAELIAAAAYYKLDEAWIAFHPVLLMGYLMQYMPSFGMKVLKKIGPGRVALLKDGSGSGYDVAAMLKKKRRS